MKQLGNLAIVCVRRSDVLLKIQSGIICLYIGTEPQQEAISLSWDDDVKIMELIQKLNFGQYAEKGGKMYD